MIPLLGLFPWTKSTMKSMIIVRSLFVSYEMLIIQRNKPKFQFFAKSLPPYWPKMYQWLFLYHRFFLYHRYSGFICTGCVFAISLVQIILSLFVPDASLQYYWYKQFWVYLYLMPLCNIIGTNNSEFICTGCLFAILLVQTILSLFVPDASLQYHWYK